jgi:nitrogen regulatory protein P-II 1
MKLLLFQSRSLACELHFIHCGMKKKAEPAALYAGLRDLSDGLAVCGGEDEMIRKIEAIIREEALDAVKQALSDIGIVGMNVFEIRGHGRQGSIEHSWRYTYVHKDMLPKIQLNIVLSEHNVEKTIETIAKAARTGQEGDGIIFIYPVEDVVRIRTGERGRIALAYPDDIDARATRSRPGTKTGNRHKRTASKGRTIQ